MLSYDYCLTAPKAPKADSSICSLHLPEFEQCGGKSNCSDWGCYDGVWAGACCVHGTLCVRQNPYYWQCLDASTVVTPQPDGASGPPSPTPKPQVDAPQPTTTPTTEAAITPSLDGSGTQAETAPGSKIFLGMKLDFDYNKLEASPELTAQFKSDMADWFTSLTGQPQSVFTSGETVDCLFEVRLSWVVHDPLCKVCTVMHYHTPVGCASVTAMLAHAFCVSFDPTALRLACMLCVAKLTAWAKCQTCQLTCCTP